MEENIRHVTVCIDIVKFDYDALDGELSEVNWKEKLSTGDFDASFIIKKFSSFFFNSAKFSHVKFQLLVLTNVGLIQITPSSLENVDAKMAFMQCLPKIIKDICQEEGENPIMTMMCSETWTCAISKELSKNIHKKCSSYEDASMTKHKILSDTIERWGGISNIPRNHSQVRVFDQLTHFSFFNSNGYSFSVMNSRLKDLSVLDDLDPYFVENHSDPIVSKDSEVQGIMIVNTQGYSEIAFDESLL